MSSSGPVRRDRVFAQTSTSVRTRLNEQLAKLQGKHLSEVDILEDIKTFTKQRSLLEKQYAESLQRLVSQFATKREVLAPPTLSNMDRLDNRGLVEIWKMLLDKTGEMAKHRQTTSELLLNKISEVIKQQKRAKETTFKKLIEIAQKMNSELLESVKETTAARKSYVELEKVVEDARTKFTEVDNKFHKKDLKFFESLSSVEKALKKASDRLQSCQKRVTVSRNSYLLCVEGTNAHMTKHSDIDLPQLMVAMDGDMYTKVRDSYMLYAQIEADAGIFVKAEFEDLREQSYLVNGEYVTECYIYSNPVIKERILYNFEPSGTDSITGINRDHGAEIFLEKDARKWSTKLTKDRQAITELEKQINGLKSVTRAYVKNPEFGTSESFTEALSNIDNLQEEIRQLDVHVTKCEARLEALRGAGVDVAKWLQKIGGDNQEKSVTSLTSGLTPSRLSQLSLPAYGSQEFDVETSSGTGQDLDAVSLGSRLSDISPKSAIGLYDYTAQRPDELDIVKDEELEILEWDDGDGWCRGRNKAGKDGYFPQSYVQSISTSPSRSSSPLQTSISSSPPLSHTPSDGIRGEAGRMIVKAIYEYNAQYEEELSFPEGALIELRTDTNGVDDGWWEGHFQGKVGVFPSVVVELLNEGLSTPPELTGIHDSTLTGHSGEGTAASIPPPPDSPPPLPPDYPPPGLTLFDLTVGIVGPPPVLVNTNSFGGYSTDSNYTATQHNPSLTVELPTPEPVDDERYYLNNDSFDDFGDENENQSTL